MLCCRGRCEVNFKTNLYCRTFKETFKESLTYEKPYTTKRKTSPNKCRLADHHFQASLMLVASLSTFLVFTINGVEALCATDWNSSSVILQGQDITRGNIIVITHNCNKHSFPGSDQNCRHNGWIKSSFNLAQKTSWI